MKVFADALNESDAARVVELKDEVFPRLLPATWRQTSDHLNAAWFMRNDGLKVCAEVEAQDDGSFWLHVSFSRPNRVPNYDDTTDVKALFVGRDRKAISVLPAASEHYNFHKFCLHMWSPLSRDPLPDFRHASGAL